MKCLKVLVYLFFCDGVEHIMKARFKGIIADERGLKEAYDIKNYTLYDLRSAYIEHADDDEDTAHLKGNVYFYMGGSKCMPRKECEWSASIYLPDVRDDGAWIDLRAVRANKSKSRVKFAKKAKKGAELFVYRGLIKPILGCK